MMDLSRLVWREGMYIGQHHFQLQQRYFEDSIRFAIEQLFFKPYGLVSYTFDTEALRNGVVTLVRGQGILPDATPFSFPDSEPAPAPIDARKLFSPTDQTQLVLLAIPALRHDSANVAQNGETGNGGARLRAVQHAARDETTGRDQRPIELGAKNFRLTLDGDVRAGEIALPVGRLRRVGAGQFAFDEGYIPPLLALGGSESLMQLVERIIDKLKSKSAALDADRRAAGAGMSEFAANEVASFWLLHTVHSSLAPLSHLLVARDVHPEQVYLELARLAGALCTFTRDTHPRDLPAYDHENLGGCFGDLEHVIRERLDWAKPTNFRRILLEPATMQYSSRTTGKSVTVNGYRALIDDERAFAGVQWVLGIRAKHPVMALIDEVPRRVKVCSANGVSFLVAHAHPGLELTHLPIPPAAIAPRADTQYFNIALAGKCDELLTKSREIGVYVPLSIPEPVVELLILYES